MPVILGSWKPYFKILEFKCLWNKEDVAPKQRYDRFSFIGEHIHVTPTFEHT